MRFFSLIVFSIAILLSSSCDEQKSNSMAVQEAPYASYLASKNTDLRSVEAKRVVALDSINSRINKENKAYSILVVDWWDVEYINRTNEPNGLTHLKGNWMKFNDNFTYEYGIYENVVERGLYHFNWDGQEIILLSDNKKQYPTLWNFRFKNEKILLEGKNYYGNNKLHIKLNRINAIPNVKDSQISEDQL